MNSVKMTSTQLYSVMYLSVLVGVFMYLSHEGMSISSVDTLIHSLLLIVINAVFAIPVFYYVSHCDSGILETFSLVSPAFSKVIASLYIFLFTFGNIRTVARFDLFVTSEMFEQTDMTLFIIAIIIICALLSLLGIETLGRGSILFSVIVVGASLLIFFTNMQEFDSLNFTPPFLSDGIDFLKDTMSISTYTVVLGVPVLYRGEIKGKMSKSLFMFICSVSLTMFIVILTIIGTLGAFADYQIFPTFAISTIGKISLFERLEAFETAAWILCVISKITFFMLVVSKCVEFIFPKINKKVSPFVTTIILSASVIIISGSIKRFSFLTSLWQIAVPYFIVVTVLPLAGCLLIKKSKINKRKREFSEAENA